MMDRNSVIGFILLSLLVVGYLYYNQQAQEKYLRFKAQQDSLARAAAGVAPDSLHQQTDTTQLQADSSGILAANSRNGCRTPRYGGQWRHADCFHQ